MLFFRYFISKDFFITALVLGFLGFLGIFFIFYLFLPIYTYHGDSATVPDVINLDYEEAMQQIKKAELKLGTIDTSQYIAELPPLTVLSQEPVGLQMVKPNRTVSLSVNRTTPPSLRLPNILDTQLEQARYILNNWKLKIGKITYIAGDAEDVVTKAFYKGRQVFAKEDKIPMYSSIDLMVTKGVSKHKVSFPRLVGSTIGDATAILHQRNLGVGSIRYGQNNKYGAGVVFRQHPASAPGDSVFQGTSFDLFVNGQPPDESSEENEGGDKEIKPNKKKSK